MKYPRIFSTDSAKAAKGVNFGYLNAIQYMSPSRSGGHGNLCSHASRHCIELCLGKYSGQAAMVLDLEGGLNSVRLSRANKARLFMTDRQNYLEQIAKAIFRLIIVAQLLGLKLVIRLNGSTDIAYERIKFTWDGQRVTLFELFPTVQFVDYTKNPTRLYSPTRPANLSLTLSYSGDNITECLRALAAGHNVAVVFGTAVLPDRFFGHRVISGDLHDLRHLDPRGVVVGLTPKGAKAKRTTTPFIVRQLAA